MSKFFNDSVLGRIEIPDYCVKIIDTSAFQRLRYLKQLGCTYFVFHGATHTRFEHSIGVCWLAGEWIKHLMNKQPELEITQNDVKLIQISSLLHDIGHGPYSHTFERFIRKTRPELNYNHEEMSMHIIKNIYGSAIGHETCQQVCEIILGKPIDKPYLGHIVHNTINGLDADKLDYFTRDSQCTSFKIGCDWQRIVYESRVINNEIVFPYKLVGDIWNLYQTRFRLYRDLYFHKTVRKIEDQLLNLMIISDKANVFKFSTGLTFVNLAHSIDDVESFLHTQDDIIGQMERSQDVNVQSAFHDFVNRNIQENPDVEQRVAHYGMLKENPMTMVKFFDREGKIKSIEPDVLASMCPSRFMMLVPSRPHTIHKDTDIKI